ncbi:acyltransferase family protein [Hyphomicrobium sp. 1Nfss2.1]|uniref:acyltransferase family protein n=1 Tax=Hyphomicrobium sp. 1Nfss2.1 TaxID=3413936 RepID=UPI003C79CE42
MSGRKIGDIEVLRAIAIGFTLLHHGHALLIGPDKVYGWIMRHATFWAGVDLFLAVSGFVIARSFLGQLKSSASLADAWTACQAFWVRRIFRILPLAWVWLALTLLLAFAFGPSFADLRATWLDAGTAVLQVANIRHWFQLNGWASGGANPVYWSLSLEEQFYILMPFVVLLAGRKLGPVVIALAAVQMSIARGPGDLLWDLRSDAILLGIAAYLFTGSQTYERLRPIVVRNVSMRRIAVVVAVAGLALLPGPMAPIAHYTGIIALLCGGLVLLASYDAGFLVGSGFVHSATMWTASRSFALYLVHMPMFHLNRMGYEAVGWAGHAHLGERAVGIVTGLALVGVAAELSYRIVEVPLRRYGKSLADRIVQPRGHADAVDANAMTHQAVSAS